MRSPSFGPIWVIFVDWSFTLSSMGQRANYVVKQRNDFELFYSHWAAASLDRDMFWGPSHAMRFIQAQKQTDAWLNHVWCEGAALIDPMEKRLLWYGGEDLLYDPAERRLHMALLRSSWSSWRVDWADNGLDDIVDALGLPRSLVANNKIDEQTAPDDWVEEPAFRSTVVTVRDGSGTRIAVSGWNPDLVARRGLRLLTDAGVWHDEHTLEVAPSGGVHIDATAKTFEFWLASPRDRVAPTLPDDWRVAKLATGIFAQLDAAKGLRAGWDSDETMLQRICKRLLRARVDSADIVEQTMTRLAKREGSVEVNPAMFDYADVSVEFDKRAYLDGLLADIGWLNLVYEDPS